MISKGLLVLFPNALRSDKSVLQSCLLFIVALCLCLLSVSSLAKEPAASNLEMGDQEIPIVGQGIQVLIDKRHQYTPQDILTRTDLDWQVNQSNIPSFGFSPHTYWFKFTLPATHYDNLLELNYALLDDISFYRLVDNTVVDTIFTGDKRPFAERPVQHRAFLFPIPASEQEHTIVLRIRSTSSIQTPLVLWPKNTFFEQDQYHIVEHGIYYGIVLVMVLYNLFVFIRLRDNAYGFYVLYVFTFALTQLSLSGFAYQFIWPNMPLWNEKSIAMLVPLIVVSAIIFTCHFLELKNQYVKLYKLMTIQIAIGLFISALSIVLPYKTMIPFAAGLSILTCSTILLTSFYVLLKRPYKYAVYFAMAWSVFLVGTVILAMNKFGIIPRNVVTESAAQIGSAIEIILLSFALAERLYDAMQRRFEAEKESTLIKEELIATQQRQNLILESQVTERTKDLQTALQQVNKLNAELSDLSTLDQVTGVRNRRYFDDMLEIEFKRAMRNRSTLSLIMLDLDHFKEVNDQYGHQAGDLCLKSVANAMYAIVQRPPDLVCRYGGEELAIILPDTAHAGALLIAEKIRKQIQSLQIIFAGRKIPVTASFGVSSVTPNTHQTASQLIEMADKALYQAKTAGRNRVRNLK